MGNGENTASWRQSGLVANPGSASPPLGPLPGVVKSLESGMIPGLESLFHHLAAKICRGFRVFICKMRAIITAPTHPVAATQEWVNACKTISRS